MVLPLAIMFSGLTSLFSGAGENRRRALLCSKAALVRQLQRAIQVVLRHFARCQGAERLGLGDGDGGDFLKDDAPGVQNMLRLIEACLFHGLKKDESMAGSRSGGGGGRAPRQTRYLPIAGTTFAL